MAAISNGCADRQDKPGFAAEQLCQPVLIVAVKSDTSVIATTEREDVLELQRIHRRHGRTIYPLPQVGGLLRAPVVEQRWWWGQRR